MNDEVLIAVWSAPGAALLPAAAAVSWGVLAARDEAMRAERGDGTWVANDRAGEGGRLWILGLNGGGSCEQGVAWAALGGRKAAVWVEVLVP